VTTGFDIMAAFRKAADDNPAVIRERIRVVRDAPPAGQQIGIYEFKSPYLRLLVNGQEGDLVHIDGWNGEAVVTIGEMRVEARFDTITLPKPKGNGRGKKKAAEDDPGQDRQQPRMRPQGRRSPSQVRTT